MIIDTRMLIFLNELSTIIITTNFLIDNSKIDSISHFLELVSIWLKVIASEGDIATETFVTIPIIILSHDSCVRLSFCLIYIIIYLSLLRTDLGLWHFIRSLSSNDDLWWLSIILITREWGREFTIPIKIKNFLI